MIFLPEPMIPESPGINGNRTGRDLISIRVRTRQPTAAAKRVGLAAVL
jgi:hypothetical protein